jgi:hypothetical protein
MPDMPPSVGGANPYVAPPPAAGGGATGPGSAAGPAVVTLDTKKIFDAMGAMAARLASSGGTPGVTDASGAPAIDAPRMEFGIEVLMEALAFLQGKTQDAQLKTAADGLQVNQAKIDAGHKESLAKIDEWIANCAAAAEKAKAAEESGWFGKIFGFIAAVVAVVVAVVATVATGGAAGPLLALAVCGAISATMSLASQISQQCFDPPGPALELSSLATMAMTAILEPIMGKEGAEKWGGAIAGCLVMAMTGGTAVLIDPAFAGLAASTFAGINGTAEDMQMVAAITTAVVAIGVAIFMIAASPSSGASGAAKIANTADKVGDLAAVADKVADVASGVDKAVDVATTASDTFQKVTRTIRIVGTLLSAASGITSGGFKIDQGLKNIEAAEYTQNADLSLADKQKIEAGIALLMARMEENKEEMKKVMDQIQEKFGLVSQIIAAGGENRALIASNIGASGTV